MKKLLLCALFLAAPLALAQTCDVTYGFESETMGGQDVGDGSLTLRALPMSEVDFNHARQLKVLNAMSKEQDNVKRNEGGVYRVDVFEIRACDGGPGVKNAEGSASIQGISYAGSTRIADEMLRQGKIINDHHKARVAKGNKTAWDHTKAKKVKRNDVGVKVKE